MNVFYNQNGVGDVLLITLQSVPADLRTFKRKNDVARITNSESGEVAGYNLFNASNYMTITANGVVEMDKEKLSVVNDALRKNGFEEPITADFSPKFVVGLVQSKKNTLMQTN